MKGTKLLLVTAAAAMLCGMLRECRDDAVCEEERLLLVDTLVYVDTVRYYMPVAKDSAVIRYVTMRLPVAQKGREEPPSSLKGELSPGEKAAGAGGKGDSVDVEVPLITRHYADSCYEAWVSGPIDPRLDSINVYAPREVVTIKEPPERTGRWGVGVFAGYGITAHGLQPCAGISINYNFWNF